MQSQINYRNSMVLGPEDLNNNFTVFEDISFQSFKVPFNEMAMADNIIYIDGNLLKIIKGKRIPANRSFVDIKI